MTKDQWITQRCSNSGEYWESVIASGWDAIPCDCGLNGCFGWKLAFVGKPRTQPKPQPQPIEDSVA